MPYIVKLYLRRQDSHHEDDSSTRPTPTHSTPPVLTQPPPLDGTSFIGSVYNFSTATGPQGTNARCANCAAQQAKVTLSTAQIPITSFLVKIAGEHSWPGDTLVPGARHGEDRVVKHLEGGLTWKVFKVRRAPLLTPPHPHPLLSGSTRLSRVLMITLSIEGRRGSPARCTTKLESQCSNGYCYAQERF